MKKLYLFLFVGILTSGCHKEDQLVQPNPTEIAVSAALPQLTTLKINGAQCAVDTSTNTYYFPVSLGKTLNSYVVSFDGAGTVSLKFDSLKVANNSTVSLPLITNRQLKVQAVDKYSRITNYNLIITGLPVVTLDAGGIIGDDAMDASFTLVNPDYVAQDSRLETSSNIMINVRGGTSRAYPKNSYLVHLVDSDRNDVDASLLGLRSDNSWILDAEYIDQARMRNRLCTDIWNSFNNVPHIAAEPAALNGTRGYMAEVFLNKKYWGLYCLTEKLDRKQLKIDKTYGNMYKATDWGSETQFLAGISSFSNGNPTWGGWQFEYPEIGDTPAPNWQYLYDVVNFVSTSDDDQFTRQIADLVDINNMADYFIFMNVTEAIDNQAKNTYFSMYNSKTASRFFYSVWDMDGTLGRNYDGSYTTNAIIGGNNYLFQRLLNLNPANFKQILKDRWNTLKLNQLSKATFNSRVSAYQQLLTNSKSFARDAATWGNITQDLPSETAYMTNWYSNQHDLVDSYINSL